MTGFLFFLFFAVSFIKPTELFNTFDDMTVSAMASSKDDGMFNKVLDDVVEYPKLTEAVKLLKKRKKELETLLKTLKNRCSEVTSVVKSASASTSQDVDTSGLLSKADYASNNLAVQTTDLTDDINALVEGQAQISADISGIDTYELKKKSADIAERIAQLKSTTISLPMNGDSGNVFDSVNTAVSGMTGGVTYCPTGWVQHQSQCYGFFNETLDWPTSVSLCLAFEGYLLEVNTKDELSFIDDYMPIFENARLSISATDLLQEGTWRWIRTSELVSVGSGDDDVIHWIPNQPDNWQGKEHYGHIYHWYSYHMNDLMCGNTNYVMCEKSLT